MTTATPEQSEAGAPPAAPPAAPAADRLRRLARWWPAALLLVLLTAPWSSLPLPGLLDGPLGSPGSLQLIALCLLFGALATGYDLLLGRTGLLSFGHALYFATGTYATNTVMLQAGLPFLPSALLGLLAGVLLAALLGSVSLRMSGIGFSMVTLAFAQAGSILVERDPGGFTGGEEGRAAPADRLPAALVGIEHTANLYWIALAYLVLTLAVVHRVVRSPTGRSGRASGRTSAGSRCWACVRTGSSWWPSCWPAPWPRSAASSTCCSPAAPPRRPPPPTSPSRCW